MVDTDYGRSPVPGSGCQPSTSAASASSRSGIPNAGDSGLVPHTFHTVGYELVRVAKAGALGKMWEVERYERAWMSSPEGWDRPRKRKITEWIPLPSVAPSVIDAHVRGLDATMRSGVKELESGFRAAVRALAVIEAGTGETA